MKIKFLKDFIAAQSDDYSDMHAIFIERGDIVDVDGCKYNGRYFDMPKAQAQWLIDNGFAEEVKEPSCWKPKYDEEYFYVGHDGLAHCCIWRNDELDNGRLRLGLVFKTKEAGIRCCDYLKAIATVRQDEGVLTPEKVRETLNQDGTVYTVGTNATALSVKHFYNASAGAVYFDTLYNANTSICNHLDEWEIITNYDWSRE